MDSRTTIPAGPAGAVELIAECQQMLAGQRTSFTPLEDYVAQRRRYWETLAEGMTQGQQPQAA